MHMKVVDFDKSSDEDDKIESEASTPQIKGKHIGTWIHIASTDTLLALVNKIKNKLNCRILY